MLRIVLADDHKLVRQGVRGLLETGADVDIVGEAEDGIQAVDLTEQLRPDILLTDLRMPGLDGLEVTRRLTRDVPDTRIIMFTMTSEEVYVEAAREAGAKGYIVKGSDVADLCEAIRVVARGGPFVSKGVNGRSSAS